MKTFPLKNLQTLIQNRFKSTSPTVQLQNSSSKTIEYLINSCGLSSKSALSTSQRLKLDHTKLQNPDSVLNFLKANGFDETQITKLVEVRPEILRCRVEDNLKPKFDYFVQNGCTGMRLSELLIANSSIIRRSLNGQIKPSFEFMKELLGGSIDDVVKASKLCPWVFTCDLEKVLKPNVDILVKEGVPIGNLTKSIMWNPRIVFQRPDDIVRNLDVVKKFGLDPKDRKFCYAFKVLIQTSESILLKKMEVFKSLGWTQEGVMRMFREKPMYFAYSKKKITKTMDFVLTTLKVERDFVIAHPYLLFYSMDRMRRRYNILKALESKELFKWEIRGVASIMTYNEKEFVKYYVAKYEKTMPGLMEMNQRAAMANKLDA
ncbi:hypothetical protein ACFE04_002871 [Oxalis oulophora]